MASLKELLFKYTTPSSRFVPIDNILVHYRDEGEGEPILLLHGAFSSLHTFNSWAKQLQKQYRVIRLDLMGFGLTGPNDTSDYSIENHVRVLKTFVNMLGLKEFNIAGSSLGGWLSWEFASRYPQRIKKMVLIDSAGFLEEENIPLPFKLARTPVFGRVIKYVVRRAVLEQFVKQVYYKTAKITTALVDRYYDLFTREGNTDAFLKLVNTAYVDNTQILKTLDIPTLILWGREDMWIPVHNAYRFHSLIPKSHIRIYPQVGHLPMEEISEESLQDLVDFLENKGDFTAKLIPYSINQED
ncbi:MAG: alpha/beta hydrolase [Aureispira sp.]|nr:alpha/beta hydrolase [Aureispira sp.]